MGHIPGAVNIPVFNNDERAEVGILYKQEGREKAIARGLEIADPKLELFLKEVRDLAPDKEILIHCWRGGMRSERFAEYINKYGYDIFTLIKGYKAYRNHILHCFANVSKLIVLGGMTGSGKTEILRHLSDMKQQVIDLEKLANHKGSAFGHFGQGKQPTTEQFHNEIFKIMKTFDPLKPVWVEDESQSIGTVRLPEPLFVKMRESPVIKIEIGREQRALRLVKEYAQYDNLELKEAIYGIRKRLGGLNTQKAKDALDREDYKKVATTVLYYYDKAYKYGLSKREAKNIYSLSLGNDDPKENAKIIMKFAEENFKDSFYNFHPIAFWDKMGATTFTIVRLFVGIVYYVYDNTASVYKKIYNLS